MSHCDTFKFVEAKEVLVRSRVSSTAPGLSTIDLNPILPSILRWKILMPDDRYAQFFWSNERLDSLLASAVRKQYTSPRFLNVQVLWPSFPRFDILVAAALDKRRRWHRAAAGIGCHRHRPVDAAARDQSESCHDLKWLAGLACGINKRETTGRQEARRHIGVVLTSMRLDRRPERASKGDQDCFSVAATFSSVSREAHARPFLSTG